MVGFPQLGDYNDGRVGFDDETTMVGYEILQSYNQRSSTAFITKPSLPRPLLL